MKIKEGFMLREVAGSYVVVAVGKRSEQFNGMVNLNETGAFLWKLVEQGASRDELLNSLLEAYEVEREKAEQDVDKFISILQQNDFVEE
ncbi:MAG: PqqD family protein [Eubacterium sp.]|nr:PqqD family protein [Eubacterium sp.]